MVSPTCRLGSGAPPPDEWSTRTSGAPPPADQSTPFLYFLNTLVPAEERDRFALNIGGNDGKSHDPVFPLFERANYHGLVIEADEIFRDALYHNLSPVNHTGCVFPLVKTIPPESYAALLHAYGFPLNFDAMKVDVDSIDLPLAREILNAGYRPKIVAIEYNPDIPPPFQWFVEYDPDCLYPPFMDILHDGIYGASAEALWQTFVVQHGYAFLGFEWGNAEHNMWFVHRDFLFSVEDGGPKILDWAAMVESYWSFTPEVAECLHMKHFCPKNLFRNIAKKIIATSSSGGGAGGPTSAPVMRPNYTTVERVSPHNLVRAEQLSAFVRRNGGKNRYLQDVVRAWKAVLDTLGGVGCHTSLSVTTDESNRVVEVT